MSTSTRMRAVIKTSLDQKTASNLNNIFDIIWQRKIDTSTSWDYWLISEDTLWMKYCVKNKEVL